MQVCVSVSMYVCVCEIDEHLHRHTHSSAVDNKALRADAHQNIPSGVLDNSFSGCNSPSCVATGNYAARASTAVALGGGGAKALSTQRVTQLAEYRPQLFFCVVQ